MTVALLVLLLLMFFRLLPDAIGASNPFPFTPEDAGLRADPIVPFRSHHRNAGIRQRPYFFNEKSDHHPCRGPANPYRPY
jgi:hypothetical protein